MADQHFVEIRAFDRHLGCVLDQFSAMLLISKAAGFKATYKDFERGQSFNVPLPLSGGYELVISESPYGEDTKIGEHFPHGIIIYNFVPEPVEEIKGRIAHLVGILDRASITGFDELKQYVISTMRSGSNEIPEA